MVLVGFPNVWTLAFPICPREQFVVSQDAIWWTLWNCGTNRNVVQNLLKNNHISGTMRGTGTLLLVFVRDAVESLSAVSANFFPNW